jgi:iron complex outermembrane receptor protein
VSGTNGSFTIENLPKTKILVQVSAIGYRTYVKTIDLNLQDRFDVALETVATELNEVVVTGLSRAAEQKRIPTPVSIVPKTELLHNGSTNIIDALASQPGISQITTGSGISKPVIRGLGYNRVVTVNDDIRQEGQQWGDEHGIEIDEYSVNRVENLKGPPVFLMVRCHCRRYPPDVAPPLQEGKIIGELTTGYQTNKDYWVIH